MYVSRLGALAVITWNWSLFVCMFNLKHSGVQTQIWNSERVPCDVVTDFIRNPRDFPDKRIFTWISCSNCCDIWVFEISRKKTTHNNLKMDTTKHMCPFSLCGFHKKEKSKTGRKAYGVHELEFLKYTFVWILYDLVIEVRVSLFSWSV